jgi:hypothetical protein
MGSMLLTPRKLLPDGFAARCAEKLRFSVHASLILCGYAAARSNED